MNLPFTAEQFLSVFEQYNQAVWPVQVFLNLLALAVVLLSVKRFAGSDRIIAGILACLWLWIGLAYHLAFFSTINPAAYLFAALNVVQGILFLVFGVFRPRLSFNIQADIYGIAGWVLIVYALIGYPVLGYYLGHIYPKSPTFGLPCPTVIFTFGVLLWTKARMPKALLIIPFLWSAIGFSAALTMGMREDIGLLVAGVVGTVLIVTRDRLTVTTSGGDASRWR